MLGVTYNISEWDESCMQHFFVDFFCQTPDIQQFFILAGHSARSEDIKSNFKFCSNARGIKKYMFQS